MLEFDSSIVQQRQVCKAYIGWVSEFKDEQEVLFQRSDTTFGLLASVGWTATEVTSSTQFEQVIRISVDRQPRSQALKQHTDDVIERVPELVRANMSAVWDDISRQGSSIAEQFQNALNRDKNIAKSA